ELGPAERKAFAARMAAGPQVELPAVPGADDVFAFRVVLQSPGFAVFIHRLADLTVDTALADRPAAMGALIVPRNEFAIDIEAADFSTVAGNHPSLSLSQFVDPPHHEGFHLWFPQHAGLDIEACDPLPSLCPRRARP